LIEAIKKLSTYAPSNWLSAQVVAITTVSIILALALLAHYRDFGAIFIVAAAALVPISLIADFAGYRSFSDVLIYVALLLFGATMFFLTLHPQDAIPNEKPLRVCPHN
jgi:hypothetical protein